jgi:hypothetical protein
MAAKPMVSSGQLKSSLTVMRKTVPRARATRVCMDIKIGEGGVTSGGG